ncbi:MBG domain-containing protein, partial [Flavobacterium sp. B11]|uniref:MBG domain-containing protein n=1 Tax=Flavobacterium movens TaxID=214860 RepID=UPI0031E14AEC
LSAGSNYAISFTESDFAVTAKPISVTADSKTKIYGSADPALTYTFLPGLVGSDAFTGALSRTAGENVGSYAIGQGSLSAGPNYAISFTESDLAVTAKPIAVTADSKTKAYGSADPVLTYTFSPGLVGSDYFTGALSRTAGENVGSYAIEQGSLSAGSNYAISYTETNLIVTAKAIAVTADSQTKIYGSADPVLTYTFSPGLVGSDAFTGALSRTAGENVGSYAIGQGTLSAGSNYAISYTESNLAVTAKPIAVTADSQTKIYSSADPVLTYTFSPGLVGSDAFTGALSRT